jgi:hypothetical protein
MKVSLAAMKCVYQGDFANFILPGGLVVEAVICIITDKNNQISLQNKPIAVSTHLSGFNKNITPVLLTILSTVLGFVLFV